MANDEKTTLGTAERASEVADPEALSDQARELLDAEVSPSEFLASLQAQALLPDAIQFLARVLTKRQAVQWACEAIETTIGDEELEPAGQACVVAARTWIAADDEENRQAAMQAAEDEGYATAAGWAAAAAGWSGGSMLPPDLDDVPPAEDLTASAAASAVLMASVSSEAADVPETQAKLVDLGVALASAD